MDHEGHGDHGAGGTHEGHERAFRHKFFVSTLLSIPVLLYSEAFQEWLGFSVPAFSGSEWINTVFAVIVFAYGGVPFLRMAVLELRPVTGHDDPHLDGDHRRVRLQPRERHRSGTDGCH